MEEKRGREKELHASPAQRRVLRFRLVSTCRLRHLPTFVLLLRVSKGLATLPVLQRQSDLTCQRILCSEEQKDVFVFFRVLTLQADGRVSFCMTGEKNKRAK